METSDAEKELLIRLDERTRTIQEDLLGMRKDLQDNYVQKTAFDPVRAIVFGGVGIVLIAVLGVLVNVAIN